MKIDIKFSKLKWLLSVVFVLLSLQAFSQATITGVIKDATNQSTLPGAAVIIQGTNYGTITNTFGEYTLTGLPTGKTVVVFSYIGYTEETIEVELSANETKKLNVNLDVETLGLEEVVIRGQLLGQTKAINQQLNSDAIVNVVSEEKIKELPDANAAESIGRISGISLERNQGEGSKVVIRGLEPRFSAISINGIKVPSNDIEDKSVDLSMISPELLQGIEVFKSPTPDMDGDAVGGAVNLVLSKAPEKPKYQLRAASGYSALRSDFKNYNVSTSLSRRFFDNKLGVIAQANAERVNRASDDKDKRYRFQDTIYSDPAVYRSIRLRATDEIRTRMGGSINLDYQLKNGELTLYSLYSATDKKVSRRFNLYDKEDKDAGANYQGWNTKQDLFSTMLSGKHTLGLLKSDWSLSYAKTTNIRPYDFEFMFKNINAFEGKIIEELSEDELIGISQLDSDSLTYLERVDSDIRDIEESNVTAALNFELPLSLGDNWSVSFKFGGKYNILDRTREDVGSWEPWYYFGIPGKLQQWDPNYPNGYKLTTNKTIAFSTFKDLNYSPESFLNTETFNNPLDAEKIEAWHDYYKNSFLSNRAVSVDNLDLTETVVGAYFMTKIKFKQALTIIPGIRYELSDNSYTSFISSLSGYDNSVGIIEDTVTSNSYFELLPHLHVKYEPAKWFSLRFSAAKTLARPNYNYIAYSAYINTNNAEITTGNPDLEHMTSMNYDLNMSFYSGKYGLLTLGGFYKKIENIFYEDEGIYLANDSISKELGWSDYTGYMLDTYSNSPDAEVYGFEVDVQTSLKFLPKPFNGVVISANLTSLYSQTTKYTNKFIQTDSVIGRHPQTGPIYYKYTEQSQREITIPGQVPLILNLSVGYEYKGFSIRVSGNRQGAYLASPSQNVTGKLDTYRQEFWRWDIAVKQRINKNLEIFFNANNINNMKEDTYYRGTNIYRTKILTGQVFNYGLKLKL